MDNRFVGRNGEFSLLDRLHSSSSAELLVVYGRRRVGKTRLLTRWLSRSEASHSLYYVAQPGAASDQLRQFSQALYRFENPQGSCPLEFTYQSWEQALEQVARLSEAQRLTLVLDEFTYLLERTPELAGLLQNTWDHLLKGRNLFLVLCGSHLGMMRRQILAYQAPLYGRASAQIHLHPLSFGLTRQFFPNYKPDERVALYSIFGGVPAYWERVDQSRSVSDNLRAQLLTPSNLMQSEPRLLLHDFVQRPDNYVSLFNAIAHGYRTQKEIGSFTGLAQGHVSRYLSVLEGSGFVRRRVPVTAREGSRKGRYHICDPYLRFYYRFLATRQAQLAMGLQKPALEEIKRHLLDFIGTHTWEEICREWVMKAAVKGKLPHLPDQVGSFWSKECQVDVVGINRMEKTLVLGECKWSPKTISVGVLRELTEKTGSVVPSAGHWKVHYVGMARGGWASQLDEAFDGENWSGTGTTLTDLPSIDEDLHSWSS